MVIARHTANEIQVWTE